MFGVIMAFNTLSRLILSSMFSVVMILTVLQISANFLQISINFLQKLSLHSVLLQKTCSRLWELWPTLKPSWIFLRKHIFVATTLQQNQNDLIFLQCFSNIFYVASRKNIFETICGHLHFLSCAFNAAYYIARASKIMYVATDL